MHTQENFFMRFNARGDLCGLVVLAALAITQCQSIVCKLVVASGVENYRLTINVIVVVMQ